MKHSLRLTGLLLATIFSITSMMYACSPPLLNVRPTKPAQAGKPAPPKASVSPITKSKAIQKSLKRKKAKTRNKTNLPKMTPLMVVQSPRPTQNLKKMGECVL